jgi:quinol-cytochrome oxidoreductase complex cytochrome b subunit
LGPKYQKINPAVWLGSRITLVHFLTLRPAATGVLCVLQVAPEARGQVGDALAAYASVSEPADLAGLFRIALDKYSKVRRTKQDMCCE